MRLESKGSAIPSLYCGSDGRAQHTVADCRMVVDLDHQVRGTHMSRFIEVLDRYASELEPRFARLDWRKRSGSGFRS